MRDLTIEEMWLVSGAGWFNEVTDFLQNTWSSIFSNPTPSNPPLVDSASIDALSNACVRGGGTPDLVVASGSAGANVRMVGANGGVTYWHFTCPR